MKGALNSHTFFATVAMARRATSALILVVEGDDDHLLVQRHVKKKSIVVIQGVGGRGSVLAAAERSEHSQMRGVRFLIDADYDRYTGAGAVYPMNVIASANHDVMMDVVLSSQKTLGQVVDTFARSARRRGVAFDTMRVLSESVRLAMTVAALRIVNDRSKYGLKLENFPFGSLSALVPSVQEVASVAVGRSRPSVDVAVLSDEVVRESKRIGEVDVRAIGDHDYFAALSRVLSAYGAKVGGDALWSGFLAAVRCEHLERTLWFGEVRNWSLQNQCDAFACPCAS